MEIPIQVAVRIYSGYANKNSVVQSIPAKPLISPTGCVVEPKPYATSGFIQVGAQSFPFEHALPMNCSQDQIYNQTVYPMIGMFLEGFDASFVTYGQKSMGKTYTMLGPGFNCLFGESEQGIIQRCVRDIFNQLAQHRERNYVINIGWVEVCEDDIHDLLDGSGNVHCATVGEVFQWLQVGLNNKSVDSVHNIFTLTLEQQWVTSGDELIQHRLSTASFCDLCCTDRLLGMSDHEEQISVPREIGLRALERIVDELATDNHNYTPRPQYNQTTLTTLLKDSFGGRAQTLLIVCISPLEEDMSETLHNLQLGYKAQCVRNFVVLNTYSDNNTPLMPAETGAHQIQDNFGLQFAASQWLKLVANAEGLFSRLIESKMLNENDRERIEEWLFLKQECEECLSSGEINMSSGRHLGPIQEADEQDETSEQEEEISCQQNTDNESDTESNHLEDLEDKISVLMEEFRSKTDSLIKEKYDSFVSSHPNAVLDSNDSFGVRSPDRRPPTSPRARRKSIQPGSVSLSSLEIDRLNKMVASRDVLDKIDPFLDSSDDFLLRSMTRNPQEQIDIELRKVNAELEAAEQQVKELEGTITTTQDLINTLVKRNESQNKVGFNKKKVKLESEYQKFKKQLNKAISHGYDRVEVERLQLVAKNKKQILEEFLSLNNHDEYQQKIKLHQKTVKATKKKLDSLHKSIKKNRKHETELKNDKQKLSKMTSTSTGADRTSASTTKNMRDVTARISHLDHVIKEKSQTLKQFADGDERDSFRHEIRQLRRTRDQLVDARCLIDRKFKKEKRLSHDEQRKLFECDEGIEAIDAAIEYKNELICGGRKSVDTNESLQREKGGRMMMARLNNLSPEEMRVLLYKYFQKAIDFRDSSLQMEKDRDFWESRARHLQNEVQRVRFESDRRAAILHQQQEAKLALYMRHINDGTESITTSSSCTNNNNDRMLTAHANNPHHHHHHYGDTDLDVSNSKHLMKSRHSDILPIEGHQYKPLDKYKEKEKSRFFSKIQMFKTQYRGGGGGNGGNDGNGVSKRKVHDSSLTIPEQNLRQLQSSAPLTVTKVTREKNKIIIQQDATGR